MKGENGYVANFTSSVLACLQYKITEKRHAEFINITILQTFLWLHFSYIDYNIDLNILISLFNQLNRHPLEI